MKEAGWVQVSADPPPRRDLWVLTNPDVPRSARAKVTADLQVEIVESPTALPEATALAC
ncbi:MAG TPA: hypothetical protein VIM12_06525 [Noviherbaspirillum sp.]|jgi:hypothetical protein|uniref:hypothetical protein n=1 Tax=Noviherbaspirillum sp. TaxID=1926288 RepID=UPI002F93798F